MVFNTQAFSVYEEAFAQQWDSNWLVLRSFYYKRRSNIPALASSTLLSLSKFFVNRGGRRPFKIGKCNPTFSVIKNTISKQIRTLIQNVKLQRVESVSLFGVLTTNAFVFLGLEVIQWSASTQFGAEWHRLLLAKTTTVSHHFVYVPEFPEPSHMLPQPRQASPLKSLPRSKINQNWFRQKFITKHKLVLACRFE